MRQADVKQRVQQLRELLALAVLKLFVPGHLNGFELRLVGLGRIAGKPFKFRNPFVHVSEPHRERIRVRILVGQGDGDVFKAVPIKCMRHGFL